MRRSRIGSSWRSIAPRRPALPAMFWLDKDRAHDARVDQEGRMPICRSMTPAASKSGSCLRPRRRRFSLERIKEGKDTISVTGNVLRDYLTDLFPILEIGTSAKMLSIVPLLNGGGLFETGAGGSAPKHVQQFQEEGLSAVGFARRIPGAGGVIGASGQGRRTIRRQRFWRTRSIRPTRSSWRATSRPPARWVKSTIAAAIFIWRCTGRRRWRHRRQDKKIAERFAKIAKEMADNDAKIDQRIAGAQGKPVRMSAGIIIPNDEKASRAMRPSATLNAIVDAIA